MEEDAKKKNPPKAINPALSSNLNGIEEVKVSTDIDNRHGFLNYQRVWKIKRYNLQEMVWYCVKNLEFVIDSGLEQAHLYLDNIVVYTMLILWWDQN